MDCKLITLDLQIYLQFAAQSLEDLLMTQMEDGALEAE